MPAAMISRFRRLTQRLTADDRGAGLVEYCLLVAMIAVVCFSALAFFGKGSGNSVDNSKTCIEAAYAGLPKPATCP